ncbi:MAG: CDP-alcohol phosphatidyltransferase family protein [Thermomicrobiales bacterium]|jgi:CDP-diacylglycerol--glycerol-3-phosphate 3-phosphatidyltransferase|nr:CDP-alcohol phosphatidyltransferase family protein [Thermomicrobiales bacterium]
MANAITVFRVGMLFVAVYLLYEASLPWVVVAAAVIGVAILLDGLDGWVARRTNTTSQLGAAFDIAGDRIVENVLWVVYAHLGLIPVWVPLLVLTRGFLVDSLRAISYSEGKTAFGSDNMMRSPITQWLTAGRFMRSLFGLSKLYAFVFLAGLVGYEQRDAAGSVLGDIYDWDPFRYFGWFTVWLSVALTVIRGVPVILDSLYTWGPDWIRKTPSPEA